MWADFFFSFFSPQNLDSKQVDSYQACLLNAAARKLVARIKKKSTLLVKITLGSRIVSRIFNYFSFRENCAFLKVYLRLKL